MTINQSIKQATIKQTSKQANKTNMSHCDSSSISISNMDPSKETSSSTKASSATNPSIVVAVNPSRTKCITGSIFILATCGLICQVYAVQSCEWYDWENTMTTNDMFPTTTSTIHAEAVGLFRFQPLLLDESGSDAATASSGGTCQAYSNHHFTVHGSSGKNGIFRKDDAWIFSAQICVLLSMILALLSIVVAAMAAGCDCGFGGCGITKSRHRCLVASTWLLATGLQAASSLAATSMCPSNDFWECPWLQGAHANASAAILFLVCWLLSMCGSMTVTTTMTTMTTMKNEKDKSHYHYYQNHHHHHHHHHQNDSAQQQQQQEESTRMNDKDDTVPNQIACMDRAVEEDTMDVNVDLNVDLNVNVDVDVDVENGLLDDSDIGGNDGDVGEKKKLSAEDLLGTNDPIIHFAVGQHANVIREFVAKTRSKKSSEN